jgi:type II pantothenate kinase
VTQAAHGAVGVDVGATLAKIAVRDAGGEIGFRIEAADALDAVARFVEASRPRRVGLTGGGAAALAARLPLEAVRVNEFAAWGSGAAQLLARQGASAGDRFLLVSLGTGTSIMLADGLSVNRIGGTALGGGTLLGLAAALLGPRSFAELTELARRGSRARVDLLVSDIYRSGEIPLAGDLTAANFGKLAARVAEGSGPAPEDVAHALMGLVGENVALICAGLGAAHRVQRVVFGGSTLRGNPALAEILERIVRALGCSVTFLSEGEFAGALGALILAEG